MTRAGMIFLLLGIGLGILGTRVYLTALAPLPRGAFGQPPDVVCWETPDTELLRQWQRVPEEDRQWIGQQVAEGKAEFREGYTLSCRMYRDGIIGQFQAREQWWKSTKETKQ